MERGTGEELKRSHVLQKSLPPPVLVLGAVQRSALLRGAGSKSQVGKCDF